MEILNKKTMKILLYFFVLPFIIVPLCAMPQNNGKIKEVIKNELKLLDIIYNDRVFIEISEWIDTSQIKINKITSPYIARPYKFSCCDLRIVNVSLKGLRPPHYNKNFSDSPSFDYVLIDEYNSYYRLFGFTSTDINYLRTRFFPDSEFYEFIDWIASSLSSEGVLTELEAASFSESIKNNDCYYSPNINRPVNVINVLYPHRLYQSIIIDYEWIKPHRVH